MSWNSTFIAINRDYTERIEQLQADSGINLGAPVKQISFEEATSTFVNGKSIGFFNGWTILCDPSMFFDENDFEAPEPGRIWPPKVDRGLENCSQDGRALGFIMSGVSGTYGMTFYEGGKLRRCRLIQEGETLIDFGERPAEEAEVHAAYLDEEDRVFRLMEKFGVPFDRLFDVKFTLYQSVT